jgi:hypothetical protein
LEEGERYSVDEDSVKKITVEVEPAALDRFKEG